MGKTIILTEKQVKKFINSLINEQPTTSQTANEFKGGADPARVSHTYLSKFGLPNGAKHENYYYHASIEDVIEMSGKGNESQFLSVFQPANAYDDNPKDYYDYIEVNDVILDDKGVKTFNFTSGDVYAAHNGLLAIKRAMQGMRGRGGKMTITFGSDLSGDKAAQAREWGGISYDSNRALNQEPMLNTIIDAFCALAINPKSLERTTSMFKGRSDEQIIQNIKSYIPMTIQGFQGFMPTDAEQRAKIVNSLIPKGFITTIDFDVDSITNAMKQFRNVPDTDNDYERPKYNEDKRKKLNEYSKGFLPDLLAKMKEIYIKNFVLFVENFLPNSKEQIFPQIRGVRFTTDYLGQWHYHLFHSYAGGSTTSQSNMSTSQGKPGRGQ